MAAARHPSLAGRIMDPAHGGDPGGCHGGNEWRRRGGIDVRFQSILVRSAVAGRTVDDARGFLVFPLLVFARLTYSG